MASIREIKKELKLNYTKETYKMVKKYILKDNKTIDKEKLFMVIDACKDLKNEEKIEIFANYHKDNHIITNMIAANIPLNQKKFIMENFNETLLKGFDYYIIDKFYKNGVFENPNINRFFPLLNESNHFWILENLNKLKDNKSANITAEWILENIETFNKCYNIAANNEEMMILYNLSKNERFNNIINSVNTLNHHQQTLKLEDYVYNALRKYVFEDKNTETISKLLGIMSTNSRNFSYATQEFLQILNANGLDEIVENILFNEHNSLEFQKEIVIKWLFQNKTNEYIQKISEQENIENEKIKFCIESFRQINAAKTTEELRDLYIFYKKANFTEYIEEYITVKYNQTIDKTLTKLSDLKNKEDVIKREEHFSSKTYTENGVPKNGNLEIYELYAVENTFLMHALQTQTGNPKHPRAIFRRELIKNPKLWKQGAPTGANYMALSLNNEKHMKFYNLEQNIEVILGWDTICHSTQILETSREDNFTSLDGHSLKPNINKQDDTEKLLTSKVYNELDSRRMDQNEQYILPTHLIVASEENRAGIPVLSDTIKEWTLYYNIPIIMYNCESYVKHYQTIYQNFYLSIKQNDHLPTQEEIEILLDLLEAAIAYDNKGTLITDVLYTFIDTKKLVDGKYDLQEIKNYLKIIQENTIRPYVSVFDASKNEEIQKIIATQKKEIIQNAVL